MNFIRETKGQEIQVELKYCERCGGLWLRPQGADGVGWRRWRQGQPLGRRPPEKRAAAAKRARKERTFNKTLKGKTFRARPRLNIWKAWLRWRCGHDKRTSDENTSVESDGAGGTTAIGAIWRDGDGTVALPQTHGSAAAAVRPRLGRGREAAVAAGARVLPVTGYVVHDEEF